MRVTAIPTNPGGFAPASVSGVSLSSLQDMLRHVTSLYGPILRTSTFFGSGEPAGGAYSGHAELFDIDGLLQDIYGQPSMEPGVNDTLFGGGKGFSLSSVMLSTIGESLERVVAGLVSSSTSLPSARQIGTFRDMNNSGLPCLSPSEVSLFNEQQYSQAHFLYERFAEDTPVEWVCGKRLRSNEEIWVPSQLVDMIHIFSPTESLIGYPVSGGLSCHTSFRSAVYHGLTEVIERDAVNVSWYTEKTPQLVKIDDSIKNALGGFAERLELDHSGGYILRHSSDVCSASTFSVVGLQEWLPRRQYCAGGGCDYSPLLAIRKAAAEYGQSRSTLSLANVAPGSSVGRSVRKMFDWDIERHLSEMTLFFQAIGYYGLPENSHHLEHYFRGEWISGDEALGEDYRNRLSVEESLDRLTDELLENGIDPIILDYSHPDWNSLSVVKVFVPELTTPFLQSRPMLGHPRLRTLRPELIQPDGQVIPLPYP